MSAQTSIDQVLKRAVDQGDVPGAVAIVSLDGKVIYEGAHGTRDLATGAAMSNDTVVWIASMTKAITGAAAMQLVERGKLSLDAPAGDVVPDLKTVQVLDGKDASGKWKTRAPKSPVTLRQLLTHTSGFGYDIWNADLGAWMEANGIPGITSCENKALQTPLLFDPGTKWEYGIGIDYAGKMVEAATGQRLGAYVHDSILAPLGMTSTAFKITPEMRARKASIHARTPDGTVATDIEIPQEPQFEMGGGGLYGTVRDYLQFGEMILNKGTHKGRQILKPETVAEMSRNNIGDIDVAYMKTAMPQYSADSNFFPEVKCKWGLSFLINTTKTPQGRSPGSLAWAGLANSFYWIDPSRRLVGVIATQVLPFFDPKAIGLFRDFETATYKAI
jgi:CubicO group peptidase (beta-lactamase class C family)